MAITDFTAAGKDAASMQAEQAVAEPRARKLSQEERNDLRKKVLRGEDLTVEEAISVYETLRTGQAGAVLTGEAAPKKSRKKKEVYSDDQLNKDLEGLGL